MRFEQTDLPGVIVIEPDVHRDGRGFFLETYHSEKYLAGGIAGPFLQDNHSESVGGTVRGLHLQLDRPQGKLVRAVQGKIFDVAVDVRVGSPTFGRWVGVMMSADDFRQFYVPPGFAHGFCVVSPSPGRAQVPPVDPAMTASPGTIRPSEFRGQSMNRCFPNAISSTGA